MTRDFEKAVQACYSTWADSYHDEYYGNAAPYPPVHKDLILKLLQKEGSKQVLDAGCGPATMMRYLPEMGINAFGFDLTDEMVEAAKKVMADTDGSPPSNIWQGSVLDNNSFRCPDDSQQQFDATICVGVLPHIPEEADDLAVANLRDSVAPGGLVIAEARNQFFALFTLNRYSYEFFANDLIGADELKKLPGTENLDEVLSQAQDQFRMDIPPIRKGKEDEPGYDEVLSRTHNPLALKAMFERAGLIDVEILFYHFHALPPMLQNQMPEFFMAQSLKMEDDPKDWRGHFMASAFLVKGRRKG